MFLPFNEKESSKHISNLKCNDYTQIKVIIFVLTETTWYTEW